MTFKNSNRHEKYVNHVSHVNRKNSAYTQHILYHTHTYTYPPKRNNKNVANDYIWGMK